MQTELFRFHDVSRFPIVKLQGRDLPPGYGPAWAAEMEMLLDQPTPFALVFPSSAVDETHEDQKLRTIWLKAHKKPLARKCRGIFSVEPNTAMRLIKKAQGAAIALAFGLQFRVTATETEADALAALVLGGSALPDDTGSE